VLQATATARTQAHQVLRDWHRTCRIWATQGDAAFRLIPFSHDMGNDVLDAMQNVAFLIGFCQVSKKLV
jgi:hypothetical protein